MRVSARARHRRLSVVCFGLPLRDAILLMDDYSVLARYHAARKNYHAVSRAYDAACAAHDGSAGADCADLNAARADYAASCADRMRQQLGAMVAKGVLQRTAPGEYLVAA